MHFIAKKNIVLASQSPRRKEILKQVGIPFDTRASNVDEEFIEYPTDVHAYVTKLATEKAQEVLLSYENQVIIGADTIVSYEGRVFPKPADEKEAKQFLQTLNGKTHVVITAVAILNGKQLHTFTSETKVTFFNVEESLIDAYVASKDPLDKAGGYGIQSGGALFVKSIEGDYYTVMGLPIAKLQKMLQKLNIIRVEGRVMNQ